MPKFSAGIVQDRRFGSVAISENYVRRKAWQPTLICRRKNLVTGNGEASCRLHMNREQLGK